MELVMYWKSFMVIRKFDVVTCSKTGCKYRLIMRFVRWNYPAFCAQHGYYSAQQNIAGKIIEAFQDCLRVLHGIGAQECNKDADGKNIGHGPFTDGAYQVPPFDIVVLNQYDVVKKGRFQDRDDDAKYKDQDKRPVAFVAPKLLQHAQHTAFLVEKVDPGKN
jgi:hypothetical protein